MYVYALGYLITILFERIQLEEINIIKFLKQRVLH